MEDEESTKAGAVPEKNDGEEKVEKKSQQGTVEQQDSPKAAEQLQQQPFQGSKLFVGQIPRSYDSKMVFNLFQDYGILECAIITDRQSGAHCGCAFAIFPNDEYAQRVIEDFNNKVCLVPMKNPLQVRVANSVSRPSVSNNRPGVQVATNNTTSSLSSSSAQQSPSNNHPHHHHHPHHHGELRQFQQEHSSANSSTNNYRSGRLFNPALHESRKIFASHSTKLSEETVHQLFSTFGEIEQVFCLPNNMQHQHQFSRFNYIITFLDHSAAVLAVQSNPVPPGLTEPLTTKWAKKQNAHVRSGSYSSQQQHHHHQQQQQQQQQQQHQPHLVYNSNTYSGVTPQQQPGSYMTLPQQGQFYYPQPMYYYPMPGQYMVPSAQQQGSASSSNGNGDLSTPTTITTIAKDSTVNSNSKLSNTHSNGQYQMIPGSPEFHSSQQFAAQAMMNPRMMVGYDPALLQSYMGYAQNVGAVPYGNGYEYYQNLSTTTATASNNSLQVEHEPSNTEGSEIQSSSTTMERKIPSTNGN